MHISWDDDLPTIFLREYEVKIKHWIIRCCRGESTPYLRLLLRPLPVALGAEFRPAVSVPYVTLALSRQISRSTGEMRNAVQPASSDDLVRIREWARQFESARPV